MKNHEKAARDFIRCFWGVGLYVIHNVLERKTEVISTKEFSVIELDKLHRLCKEHRCSTYITEGYLLTIFE